MRKKLANRYENRIGSHAAFLLIYQVNKLHIREDISDEINAAMEHTLAGGLRGWDVPRLDIIRNNVYNGMGWRWP
jgi:hypothetical protein